VVITTEVFARQNSCQHRYIGGSGQSNEKRRAGRNNNGVEGEEHAIVKKGREHNKKKSAKEINVIRSRPSLEIGTDFFSSNKFRSQLKEEKGRINENRKEPDERNLILT